VPRPLNDLHRNSPEISKPPGRLDPPSGPSPAFNSLEFVQEAPVGAIGDDCVGGRFELSKLLQPASVEPKATPPGRARARHRSVGQSAPGARNRSSARSRPRPAAVPHAPVPSRTHRWPSGWRDVAGRRTYGPRNGNDAAGPAGHNRDLQPSAEPHDEQPRNRQAIVAPATTGSHGDPAVLDSEQTGLLPGREGHSDTAAPNRGIR
jgi:hypothetical protein